MDTTSPVSYRPLEGHPSHRVGDDGTLQWRTRGGHWRTARPALLNGTVVVRVSTGGRRRVYSLARLVLSAFRGTPPGSWEPLHFPNPDPTDCRLANLRWAPWGTCRVGLKMPGRQRRGEANPAATLTEAIVLEARRMARGGVSVSEIAERFGKSPTAVSRAVRGLSWGHLPGAVPEVGRRRGEEHADAVLTDADVRALRRYMAEGASQRQAARVFGVSQSCASALARGLFRREAGGPITPSRRVARRGPGSIPDTVVREVRRFVEGGGSLREAVARFGVSKSHAHAIARGKARQAAGGNP